MTPQPAIEIEGLSKYFGRRKKRFIAVDKLSLSVPRGLVYGFLGPNGAGKSTTIRMLLGLMAPHNGSIRIYGTPAAQASHVLRERVGALIEHATLYPFMTGRGNLEILARTSGCYDAQRIDRLLHMVDMHERADRKAAGYSTGMKQRIGLAAALLHDPDLVILDEPTNGLDPRGIQEMRAIIRRLVDDEGKTVFLSSHMLHEVEQVCDHVAIINQGRLVQQGRVADLLDRQAGVRLDVDPLPQAISALEGHYSVQRDGDMLLVDVQRDDTPHLLHLLAAADVNVYQVIAQRRTLEDLFLDVTGVQAAPDGVPDEEPAEHQNLGGEEDPHAHFGGIKLLLRRIKVMGNMLVMLMIVAMTFREVWRTRRYCCATHP